MNGLVNSVSFQIHRAISEANNEQVLSHIQASVRSGSGQKPKRDGTFRLRDRNIYPKELSTVRSEEDI